MDFLEHILGYVMRGIYWLCPNYIVSLLIFALFFQIVLFPLGWKQQKNMVNQARLRPKEMAIRNKYAGRNDQKTMEKLRNEIMELYQKEGQSQMAGCLPMLVQMIIIFPLYWVVIRPLQYAGGLTYSTCYSMAYELGMVGQSGQPHTTFQIDVARKLAEGWRPSAGLIDSEGVNVLEAVEGMVSSRTGVPTAQIFGVDLGITPFDAFGTVYWALIFIPIINLALTYLSQFLSRKFQYQNTLNETAGGTNQSMKIMMYTMPLMTMFVTFSFSSAIGIYWIFRTMLSMLQQFILYKALPYPKFTEEDYKNAEKELKGKKPVQREYNGEVREYRSLHHIDDDE
ncbi:MAG: YidC/Oxa1 family membrane protein insertase [Clostridia bacterium]|nr:YidC/Oxa1 family membrane protein insertase [Clostridia bacterium]